MENKNVFYVCDRKARCRNSFSCGKDCFHTTDIDHAVGFKPIRTNKNSIEYWEQRINDEAMIKIKNIGAVIKNRRELLGMSAEELAGKTTFGIRHIEAIEDYIQYFDMNLKYSIILIVEICHALGLSIYDFIEEDE